MPSDSGVQLPVDDVSEVVDIEQRTLTLATIEHMLGMNSTVDIINNIKSYIMGSLTPIDEYTKKIVASKVDKLIEALGRDNYTPTTGVYLTPPTHTVYLTGNSIEEFINKISKCSYIKWRLASPMYWGRDRIGISGVFKR